MRFEGKNYYVLSAIELKSRQSWAKKVGSLSSKNAKEFLEEILIEVNYPIHTIQTDNGSEFKRLFDQAIEEPENTSHVWSYPKSPKTNGYVDLTGLFKMNVSTMRLTPQPMISTDLMKNFKIG